MAATAIATALPDDILCIILSEFHEMPGMRLTMAQVRRLWHLGERDGERAVEALVARGALARDEQGRICLASYRVH